MADAELQQSSQEPELANQDLNPLEPEPPSADLPARVMQQDRRADVYNADGDVAQPPASPLEIRKTTLPDAPAVSARIKKKVPWKGKNIIVLFPCDDKRGLPGGAPAPLRPDEIEKMFASWKELGYNVDGFDHFMEECQPAGTDDSQSRQDWPTEDDMARERAEIRYRVLLPDLNAWKHYVDELQEAKLRALGVSFAPEGASEPSISPPTTIPSRQASAQYPSLPFSPPIPTSSASSNHGLAGPPLHAQLLSGVSSPGLSTASPTSFAPGKFDPRQSISMPPGSSPFQLIRSQPWSNPAGIPHGNDLSLNTFSRVVSPQSPFGFDGLHQRHQSMQYFPQQMAGIASPRLQDVGEDDEEMPGKSPSKTPEPTTRNSGHLHKSEIQDGEYHLEEQLRNQLEHEDYNPRSDESNRAFPSIHDRQSSAQATKIPERFANEPGKPMELHHPRPSSRGHSLSQSFFQDPEETRANTDELGLGRNLDSLREVLEASKDDGDGDDGDDGNAQEIQTNPSNLGTPVQNFDFVTTVFGQHQNRLSASSNPWQEQSAGRSSARHSNHSSRPSLPKLNVQAPEFKFDHSNMFSRGAAKAMTANSSRPSDRREADSESGPEPQPQSQPWSLHTSAPPRSAPQFFGGTKMHAGAPSFSPGKDIFSFSTSGPKFRPDAPSFTPFQPFAKAVGAADQGHTPRQDSIFGNIKIPAGDIVRPAKKSKAVPIVRPSSGSSAFSPNPAEELHDGPDGRLADDSRVKRAKSANADGDALPTFAERPEPDEAVDDVSAALSNAATGADPSASKADESSVAAADDSWDGEETLATPVVPADSETTAKNIMRFDFEHKMEESQNSLRTSSFGDKLAFATGVGNEENSVREETAPAAASTEPDPTPHSKVSSMSAGLASSRFAKSDAQVQQSDPMPSIETSLDTGADREPTFEEIDAVMQQMEIDPSIGVKKSVGEFLDVQPQPVDSRPGASVEEPVPEPHTAVDLPETADKLAPVQMPAVSNVVPSQNGELEDPFVDPSVSSQSSAPLDEDGGTGMASELASDWEGAFTEDEHEKLESRARFFDGRINEVVGALLTSRLEPLEKTLTLIEGSLAVKSRRYPSSRRRSASADVPDSDADDEDEEPDAYRSTSPRRDRSRLEQMRLALTKEAHPAGDMSAVLKALLDVKEQLATALNTATEAEGQEARARNQNAAATTESDGHSRQKIAELQALLVDLGERLSKEQSRTDKEMTERRAVEDAAAELHRKLQAAETRVEVEIINRSVFDQRVADLEERLRLQEDRTEEEVKSRRAAEDRLSEVQRLLRISSEEESRLCDLVDDKESKIKSLEQQGAKDTMRMTLLEAAQNNSAQTEVEMANKLSVLEGDLKAVRQDNNHCRSEAEKADEDARRAVGELAQTLDENKRLRKSLDMLTVQLEENERLRESWRSKFMSLQDDMGRAAHEVAADNARRAQSDQAILARQEVLDARLQAEAKTRERLEVEMERLQENERSGLRAVNECKRLEGMLVELRMENHELHQAASHYQREFEEARESGASEVKRTRLAMQASVEAANNQVNVIRIELEEQNSRLRAELDHVKLEADTAKAQTEMLLEEAQSTKAAELEAAKQDHQNEMEDVQARYERRINSAAEDASRSEQQLLERLSLSSSKIEHLQDRVLHLEDKLEIAKEAAAAAAQAAKSAGAAGPSAPATIPTRTPATATALAPVATFAGEASKPLELPEKISPQALRESIMVLQEQLQAREQRNEELEQRLSKMDPEAGSKISKRDDEISWLRELLAVRRGDIQDIITALSGDVYDRHRVKDAAIRLKANLQMEEQERERAMNGMSAISLPRVAQSIQAAASPRVAQTIGPIAAAWGNWRKSNQPSLRSISGVLSSPADGSAAATTPSKSRINPGAESSLLSGLMTPPASGPRQTPAADNGPQPTAFASTGRRFTSQSSGLGLGLGRGRGESSSSRRFDDGALTAGTPPRHRDRGEQLASPQIMRESGYDSDAQPGEFDEHDFFEDD